MSGQSSYRNILKATSIFGGSQAILIIVSMLKGKFIATLLGPEGMGIISLFTSTLTIVITLFGLGLNNSAIRNISQAHASGDNQLLSKTVRIFRSCLLLCASAGALFLCIFSPFLSNYTFGNDEYMTAFCFLSLFLIATLLTQGNTSLLQGTRRISDTARSTITGSVAGLLISLPFYFFMGFKGIVPAMIISAIVTFMVSYLYAKKVSLEKTVISRKEIINTGTDMIKLGTAMIIAQLIGQLCIYLTNRYINIHGGEADVGLYNAALNITYQSVLLIFAAMTADYYPRLVAAADDSKKMNETVNQQGEIIVLIAFPILSVFIIFAPLLIFLLLSPDFYAITEIIRIIAFGMLLKAISYSLGYISISKGDKKNFLLWEGIISNIIQLCLNITGYILGGLEGLAISFVLIYAMYLIFIFLFVRKRYGFILSHSYRRLLINVFILFCCTYAFTFSDNNYIIYFGGSIMIIISSLYALKELNRRIDIKELLSRLKKK